MWFGPKCTAHATKPGLIIRTKAADGNGVVHCNVGNSTNVLHVVEIVNKRLFDVVVECIGTVRGSNPKITFTHQRIGQPADKWSDTIVVSSGSSEMIDVAYIKSIATQSGKEKIYTSVKGIWDQPGLEEELLLEFEVTAS